MTLKERISSPLEAGPSIDDAHHQLFNRSVAQNEVLFSSAGLMLVSLDRLYCLKSVLSSCARTRSPRRRRRRAAPLRARRRRRKGHKGELAVLVRCLGVAGAAVADLDCMHRRAYGGPGRVGAISGVLPPPPPPPGPTVRAGEDDGFRHVEGAELDRKMVGLAVTTMEPSKPPSPRGPLLRGRRVSRRRHRWLKSSPGEDDGDLTARPEDRPTMGFNPWPGSSIDQVLGAGRLLPSPASSSRAAGPMTPSGYDDISPISRGELGSLMVENTLHGG
ncbi:Uncharacterized protein TCAP_05372 [Tolypocladium capitatum]|uniref:DUF7582 domain-containing protein n=1 Tax=Tolypocladium capitatum TaxID=45235 RepID=A0A2K3QAW0_9HYPO|nr:Uncharacterized protein TCAP_05372 [Tolypocladium capitatum]